MTKKELEQFKKLLLEKREEFLKELKQLRGDMSATLKDASGENSAYSFHMADIGTDNMEREKAFFFATREGKYLNRIEEALQRIENGTYGLCVDCIDEEQKLCETCPWIPKERLLAVPTATRCVPCKERAEKLGLNK
ncbi:MAG: TraR/DksA family transcriptional regulator [Calditrichaeota bacterium]|nr:MAG: TraR/DksA family transcriptional regulator [Calditrichota bacterium]